MATANGSEARLATYMERLKANPLYEKTKAEIEELLSVVQDQIADGLQLRDLNPIVRQVIFSAQKIVEAVDAASGSRRQLFIDICTAAWEDQGKPIDLPWIPNLLERRVVDPLIGNAVEFLAAVFYDYLSERPGGLGFMESSIGSPDPDDL